MGELKFNLFNIISIVAISLSLVFVLQNLILSKKKASRKIISLFLLNVSILILFFLFLDLKKEKASYVLLPFFIFALLSVGPLLWVYIRSSTIDDFKIKKRHWLPPIFFAMITVLLFIVALVFPKSEIVLDIIVYMILGGMTVVFIAQSVYYVFKCIALYKKHQKSISETFSYTEQVNLNWLKYLIAGYIVFIAGLVFAHAFEDEIAFLIFYTVLFGYILFIGLVTQKQEPVIALIIEEKEKVKVSGNAELNELEPDFFKDLKHRLIAVMEIEKVYLDDSLSMSLLANKLETNSKYLSQLINQGFEKSFVVFVNEYRVEEAKRLLDSQESSKITIEGIGYDSGFKSKSTFNAAFKKIVGMTPTAYLKK